jgi:class 3 adenylate cyclase/tetratricopeptide (TPR) repeat protein
MEPMSEERRLVTVLFADVTGSTAMGEELDPEDMRALLGRYYAIAREVVAAHGGTLEKFIGDAVMAVFGLPTAHDDDAGRAAAAALALRDQVRDDPGLGDRLPIRVGLSTGEVVAAMDAERSDFLVTGDAVNLAARLQQGAGSWDIVCSERMAQAAGPGFAFGPPQEFEARGKSASLRIQRLEGVATGAARPRLPFLGRDADVDQLELTAGRAIREKRPYLVTITAPAGTGKSRLLEEFLERLAERQPEALVLTAQCLPYGQRLTYWPLHALLRQLLDLPEDVDTDRLREAAQAWLEQTDDPAPARTAELLAATFGAAEKDPIDRAELFAAWRMIIELAAAQKPLVLVVEDLHWSADSLLDLIEVVLQPRQDAALLLIVLARPELLDRRPTWGGGRRNYISLALEPLDDLAISALVDFHLHGPPDEVVAAVVARAGGNPFFAGELARAIADKAPNLHDPDAVAAVMSAMPDTVHAAVLSRIDLLPPTARRMTQLGSVYGRSFRLPGVTALASHLTEGTESAIDHLLEHDLIRPSGADEYTFRHILIREAAYQTLPRAERSRLHGAAGTWLESQAVGREDEQAELVAFHFREAVTLATASGGDLDPRLVERAVAWLGRAAMAAIAGAAFTEASRHLRAAIEIAPRDDLPELWARLGDIFGGGNQAAEAYATAARLGRELGRSPDFVLRATSGELMVHGRWGGSVGAPPPGEHIAGILAEVHDLRQQATDQSVIGWSLVAESFLPFESATLEGVPTEDDWRAAKELAERGAAIAREIDHAPLLSAALDALTAHTLGTDPEAGLAYSRERLALEARLPLFERTDIQNMVAWCASALGEFETVLEAAEVILRDLAPNQAQAVALSLAAWELWALAMLGRWDEVAAANERASRYWEEAGRISSGFAMHGYIAAAGVGRARGDDRLTGRAVGTMVGITEQFPEGQLFGRLSAFVGPDFERLVSGVIIPWEPYISRLHYVEQAVGLCADHRHPIPRETLDRLLFEARSRGQRLLAAQVLRARGLQERDANNLREALDWYTGTGSRPYIARTQVELGMLSDDAALVASGQAALEALGDMAHLGRVAATAR